MHRQITEHWLWEEKPFSKGQAWIDLILLANHKDEKFPYKEQVITCKRGNVYRSISYLADRWGWSRKKATVFLKQLESDRMVSFEATTHGTTITIEKYSDFQIQGTTKEQQKNSKGTAEEQQRNTYKNVKNDKECKEYREGEKSPTSFEEKKRQIFNPPTVDEVRAYCQERGNKVVPETFVDFYTGKGWMVGKNKMKDWRAAVRTWEKRKGKDEKTKRNRFHNCESHGYDYEEILKQMGDLQ